MIEVTPIEPQKTKDDAIIDKVIELCKSKPMYFVSRGTRDMMIEDLKKLRDDNETE